MQGGGARKSFGGDVQFDAELAARESLFIAEVLASQGPLKDHHVVVDVNSPADYDQPGFLAFPLKKGHTSLGFERGLMDELGAELRFHHCRRPFQGSQGIALDLQLRRAQIRLSLMYRRGVFGQCLGRRPDGRQRFIADLDGIGSGQGF